MYFYCKRNNILCQTERHAMKGKIWIVIPFILILLYPHTRFAHIDSFDLIGKKDLNTSSLALSPGETFRLTLRGTNKRVRYKSLDFKVASVNFLGTVTAHRSGTTIIYATQDEETYSCKVTVN